MHPDPTQRRTAFDILQHPRIAANAPIEMPPRKKITRKLFSWSHADVLWAASVLLNYADVLWALFAHIMNYASPFGTVHYVGDFVIFVKYHSLASVSRATMLHICICNLLNIHFKSNSNLVFFFPLFSTCTASCQIRINCNPSDGQCVPVIFPLLAFARCWRCKGCSVLNLPSCCFLIFLLSDGGRVECACTLSLALALWAGTEPKHSHLQRQWAYLHSVHQQGFIWYCFGCNHWRVPCYYHHFRGASFYSIFIS